MDFQHVVIIGAGPAGAVAAHLLARLRPDWRILLIDAEAAPRHRPCGEYLSPGAVGLLERAGLAGAVRSTGARPLSGVAIVGRRGGMDVAFSTLSGADPAGSHGLGVRRERFDRALQDAAAQRCDLRRATRLTAFRRDGDRWRVAFADGTRCEAALLVGADGRHSLVRRYAGLDAPTGRRRFALVCRARGVAHRDRVEMHLGPLGQIGLCPLGDGEVNLNLLLAPPSAILLRHRRPPHVMRAALAATATLAGRVVGLELGTVLATGSLPQRSCAVAATGLCLVGDAAGFCDPFTGEGMSLALRGAEALAATVGRLDLDRSPSAADLSPYASAYARGIGRRQRLGEALQPVLARRGLSERAAAWLGRCPPLAEIAIADAAGCRRGVTS